MSEQITSPLAELKDDSDLREKLQYADLDAAKTLVKEAGFDVSKADWLTYQEEQSLELSDEELVDVAGGKRRQGPTNKGNPQPLGTGRLIINDITINPQPLPPK